MRCRSLRYRHFRLFNFQAYTSFIRLIRIRIDLFKRLIQAILGTPQYDRIIARINSRRSFLTVIYLILDIEREACVSLRGERREGAGYATVVVFLIRPKDIFPLDLHPMVKHGRHGQGAGYGQDITLGYFLAVRQDGKQACAGLPFRFSYAHSRSICQFFTTAYFSPTTILTLFTQGDRTGGGLARVAAYGGGGHSISFRNERGIYQRDIAGHSA